MGEAIVVGTDGSDRANLAVEEAVRLARGLAAELHVVSAFERTRGTRIAGAPEGAVKVWQDSPDTQVDATLAAAATKARAHGVEVTKHALELDPAEALLEVARDVGAGMIVVGSKGTHGARRLALGNVPNKVSHKASCNVLIVNTEPGAPPAPAAGGV